MYYNEIIGDEVVLDEIKKANEIVYLFKQCLSTKTNTR
ncbi:hypothetical protein RR47_GL000588 [Enterococcus columbae DSM 7374 = ATCC 51263]|nr:hypothetical protein RR47_GL000588 [Enterococcus columbae DSM 7374 = ATCC 51263]